MFYNAIKVTKMMDGVYEMKEFDSVTLWLIEGDDKCLLIDTGMGLTDLPATIAGITDKPAVVVNSHIHIDHVGGNGQFPEVMCGRFDEPYAHIPLSDADKQLIIDVFKEVSRAGVTLEGWDARPAKRVIALKEGDIISLGGVDIEVYEIPGHSLGSIALLDRKHRLIFTGDTIFTTMVGLTSDHTAPLSVASTTLSVYLDSLKKLAALKDHYDYIVPSHADPGEPNFLEQSIVDTYIEGIENILSGESTGHKKTSDEKVVRVKFEVGGLAYNPNRL
jgi:glyoxylase-like metal-dependent hydrolase (beta-lactamase superfamily II)